MPAPIARPDQPILEKKTCSRPKFRKTVSKGVEYSCETYISCEVQLAISRTEHGWYISERVSTNDGQLPLGAARPEIPNLATFRPRLMISYRFGRGLGSPKRLYTGFGCFPGRITILCGFSSRTSGLTRASHGGLF